MSGTLQDLARDAVQGDRHALEQLVSRLQGDIYGLAIRMLWNREDAEDATQEILVRVVTRLAQFDFRSQLRTWVYRIALNYLLDVRKSPVERMKLDFEVFAADLTEGLSDNGPQDSERSVLVEEVKIGCTLAMLQCLDRPHRAAYVLGEIFEFAGPEAAEALDISPALFRKRLQHARQTIVAFARVHCGLVSESAACACHRRVSAALRNGRVRSDTLDFAAASSSFSEAKAMIHKVEETRRTFALHQQNPPRALSVDLARRIAESLDSPAGTDLP
jgi:RNA polymerase sigma factor (sigma-70 family)